VTQLIRSTDGVQIALHDLGGAGPPLVFVHATGFHAWCYRRIAERLHDIRRCYGVDLRGHGDSTTPSNDRFEWEAMAEDLGAAIEHLHPDGPIDFAGHSMGGATIVRTELRQPGTIRRAWLFEPIIFPNVPDRPPSPLVDLALKRRATFESHEAAIERYASRPPFDAIDREVLEDYVRHGFEPIREGVTLKCAPTSEAATFINADPTLFDRVHAITTPIEIVGSTDGDVPALFAPRAAAEIPSATYSCWDGGTHFGPFADPARAAEEIRAFIS